MVLLVDRALCLHRYPFSESSLVAHVLTSTHGRVHLLARGAYRMTSRYYAVLDLFDELEIEWDHSPKRELQTLRSGTLAVRRRHLTEDLAAFEAGGTILELCDIAARHETHDAGLFAWASAALDELAATASPRAGETGAESGAEDGGATPTRSPDEILVRAELSFLGHLGLAPALETCAACGGPAPAIVTAPEARAAFSAGAGGRLCRRCAEEARAAGRRVGTLPVRVLEDGRDLGSPEARMRAPLSAARIERVRDFVGRFLDYHLETRPRSQRAFLSAPNRNAPQREAAGSATDEPPPVPHIPIPRRLRRHAAIVLITLVASWTSGCSSLPRWVPFSGAVPSVIDADEVPAAIQKAEAALAADDSQTALEWMRAAALAKDLPTQERDRVQVLLEKAADRRIEVLSKEKGGADELADLVDLDLPRQIAVQAGMRAAELMVADDEPIDAYQVLKRVDAKFPLHYDRQRSGDLMCDIGLKAIQDGPGFLGFFSTQDEGQEILEYVILNAPWARRCDEAYQALSDLYEHDREWALAIDREQKLVLNHPGSPLRVAAQAHVPHMRLASIKSPEYDRSQIQMARDELQTWILSYTGKHELEATVRVDLGDALRRLSDNDLIVSRFYHRVDNVFGARTHAQRAIAEAREAGDEERARAAEAWLASLPADSTAEAAAPGLQPGARP